jgi:hypothetical protein
MIIFLAMSLKINPFIKIYFRKHYFYCQFCAWNSSTIGLIKERADDLFCNQKFFCQTVFNSIHPIASSIAYIKDSIDP